MINKEKEISKKLNDIEKTVAHSSMSFNSKIQVIKNILELKKIF